MISKLKVKDIGEIVARKTVAGFLNARCIMYGLKVKNIKQVTRKMDRNKL